MIFFGMVDRQEGKYWIMLGLVGSFFLVELIVAVITGSLALRADAFHMATDFLALGVALGSLHLSRRERSVDFTYGWLRMEVIGGLINSVILLTVCFMMGLEVIETILDLNSVVDVGLNLEEIDLVLIVAGIGMMINIIGLVVFCGAHAGHSHGGDLETKEETSSQEDGSEISSLATEIKRERSDFNHMAVMLHIFGDFLGSLVVLISGMIMKWGGQGRWRYYLDPLGTIVIILVIGVSSIRLLLRCVRVLLHRIPQGMNSEKIQELLVNIPGVVSIHEFHLWSLTGHIVIATCHLKINNDSRGEDSILEQVKNIFHSAGIHNSTVQLEIGECEPCGINCHELRCCQENSLKESQ